MPRRSSAAFHSAHSARASWAAYASSICKGGRTSSTTSQRSTWPRVTETTASTTSASGLCSNTMRTWRSTSAAAPATPASTARTTSLGGSHKVTKAKRKASLATSARPLSKTIRRADFISSPVSGDNGCRDTGAGTAVVDIGAMVRGGRPRAAYDAAHGRCGRTGGPQRP